MHQTSVLVVFLIVFIEWVGFGIMLPNLPYIAHQYGATGWTFGCMMALYSGVQFLVSPIWGRISDYIGRRNVLILCLLGSTASLALLGAAGSVEWIFIARLLAGLSGSTLSTAYAYVGDIIEGNDRRKVMGMLSSGSALGLIFGPAIGALTSRFGFGMPVLVAVSMVFFSCILAVFKLDERRLTIEARAATRYKRFDFSSFRLTLEEPRTKLAARMNFLVTFAMASIEATFALYLLSRYEFPAETTGFLLAMMGATIVGIQALAVNKVSTLLGNLKTIILGALLYSLGVFGFTFSSTSSSSILVFFVVLLAAGQGLLPPTLASLAASGAAPRKRETAIGVFRSFGSMARIIAPPIAGWCFDHVSWRWPLFFSSGVLLFVSAVCSLWVIWPSRVSEMTAAEQNPYLFD